MGKYIMALDAGTTSNRCILFDQEGKICSVAQKEFTQFFPKPGWVEHNADEIWSAQLGVAVEAMSKIGASAGDISALGISNQRETVIVWDRETGVPVYNAIVWQCRRTSEYCDRLKEKGLNTRSSVKNGAGHRSLFFSYQDPLDFGKRRGRQGESKAGKTSVWDRRYLADLETDKGAGSCNGLLQCVPHHAF